MSNASLIDGLRVRVGYCTQTTAKLAIYALQDTGTLSVTCSGGSVSITTPITGLGADNSARPGQVPLYYAKAQVTGLQAGVRYSYTVSKNGFTVSGTFRTLPRDGADFAFIMGTCEHGVQQSPVNIHQIFLDYAESQAIPVYWYMHIDDVWYADSMKLWGFDPTQGSDAQTSLALSNPSTDPQDSGLSWDYCVNWAGYIGFLRSWSMPQLEARLEWHQNMPTWMQWGDHEVASNWLRGQGGSGNWYGPTAGYSAAADYRAVGTANFFSLVATANWEALFGQMSPPKLGASGQHWGATVGPVAIAACDMNSFADGRHGLTYGAGTGTGRQADGTVNLGGSGNASLPYLGSTQIGELLAFYQSADKPFNFFCTSNGLGSHNEPWAQWWVSDTDDLFGRASTGFLNQSRLNGATGKLAILKGDTHAESVVSYHSNGTAGGMGGATQNNKEVWEICPGTINGSASALTTYQYKIWGEVLRYVKCAASSRSRHIHAFVHVTVIQSEYPMRVEVRLMDTTSGRAKMVWGGQWVQTTAGNKLLPLSSPVAGI